MRLGPLIAPFLTLPLLTGAARAQPAAVVMEPVMRLVTPVGTFDFAAHLSTPLLAPRAPDRVRAMNTPAIRSHFRDIETLARENGYGQRCRFRTLLVRRALPLSQTVAFTTGYHKALLAHLRGVSSSTDSTEFQNELGRQRQMVSVLKSPRGEHWINLSTYSPDARQMVIAACLVD